MLSRVAERMYWGARLLERAENTARLVRVYDAALLDLPADAGVGWPLLVDICDARAAFDARYPAGGDRETLKFLISDPQNPSSIVASLGQARENFRTTRDLCPTEAWRSVNELYLYGKETLPKIASPRRRHEVLSGVVQRVQQLTGLLSGTMSHGDAYHFIRVGRNIERADMTTRIIDIAAATLLGAAGSPRDAAREYAVDGRAEVAVRLPDVPPVRAPAHPRRGCHPFPAERSACSPAP
jgi:uncharacterized alpha-E superfamily protein